MKPNFLEMGHYDPYYMFDLYAIGGDIVLKAHCMLSKVNQLCGGVIAKLRVNTLIKK